MTETELLWSSGVAGAQCGQCGQVTIVRWLEDEWWCRQCWEGDDEEAPEWA